MPTEYSLNRFDFALVLSRGWVEIEGGVVSGVLNPDDSGVGTPDWRPRHDERYHAAGGRSA
jgi:hypothetical protein